MANTTVAPTRQLWQPKVIKAKHGLTIRSSNHEVLVIYSNENLCPHKKLRTNVYSSFIHKCLGKNKETLIENE